MAFGDPRKSSRMARWAYYTASARRTVPYPSLVFGVLRLQGALGESILEYMLGLVQRFSDCLDDFVIDIVGARIRIRCSHRE